MATHARLKNEFTEDEKHHHLILIGALIQILSKGDKSAIFTVNSHERLIPIHTDTQCQATRNISHSL